MKPLPTLVTERLVLRPFSVADASMVEELAGARAIADTTLNIPHPYPKGAGALWIATHAQAFDNGEGITLAVCKSNETHRIVGAAGIGIVPAHARGELGYWIAEYEWGNGYATESSRALIDYAFSTLGLHRIQARHFTRNPSSGRVMQKLGMRFEGINREAFRKGNSFEDTALYSILENEWRAP
jgi:RimJ/RimL family protein N-acetyltransferase